MTVLNSHHSSLSVLPVISNFRSHQPNRSLHQPKNHAETFFAASSHYPEIYTYSTFGPYATVSDFIEEFVEGRVRRDPTITLFAIIDKTQTPAESMIGEGEKKEGTLAGFLGFLNTSRMNLCTEIGFVTILPQFQRTHVTSNAVGLLLHYSLDLPSAGGLGLRRVVWQTNALNAASVRAGERMGFRKEGILRWDRVLPSGKVGNGGEERVGDPRQGCPGRDTAILSLCWDDWESGGRERVDAIMARKT